LPLECSLTSKGHGKGRDLHGGTVKAEKKVFQGDEKKKRETWCPGQKGERNIINLRQA